MSDFSIPSSINANIGPISIQNGEVYLNNQEIELDNPQEAQSFLDAVSEEDLQEFLGLLHLKIEIVNGEPSFVPDDGYDDVSNLVFHGSNTQNGIAPDAMDQFVGEAWESLGFPNPYSPNTTPNLYNSLQGNEAFTGAVDAMQIHLGGGTSTTAAAFKDHLEQLTQSVPHGNVNEIIFAVMKAAVKEGQEDKKFIIKRMTQLNEIGKKLGEYLDELKDHTIDLAKNTKDILAMDGIKFKKLSSAEQQRYIEVFGHPPRNKNGKEKKKLKVDVKESEIETTNEVRILENPDFSSLDADGNLRVDVVGSETMSQTSLNAQVSSAERMREELNNLQEEMRTKFRAADTASNQTFNMLISILKNTNQANMGILRNLL